MSKWVWFLGWILILAACHREAKRDATKSNVREVAAKPQEPERFLGFPLDRYSFRADTIRRNETFGKILMKNGFSPAEVYRVTQELNGQFDVRKIKSGNVYFLVYQRDKKDAIAKPYAFVYEQSPVEYKVVFLNENDREIPLKTFRKPVQMREKKLGMTIRHSLFGDLEARRVSPVLALKLSDIYAWTVDFFHLYPGDGFKVIYDDKYTDSTYLGVGDIKAAVFYHRGDTIYAFRYFDSIHGQYEYFDEKGRNLRKQFLKSPLKFGRITSRYSMRRYVRIYGRVKPHLGTDFAAPVGTPIRATADGIVVKAGYTRGNGNYVKIRHNSTYATQYLHMRNFAKGIRPGVRVKQGQIIGYVGMTGYTTGPHVCYRFWKNGRQVDPLKEKMPEAKALDKSLMANYRQFISALKNQLDSIPLNQSL